MKKDDLFQVYLDQDGVLADFDASVSDAKKYPHLTRLRQEIWKVLPQLEGFEQYEMKVWFQENAKLITSYKDVAQGHRLFKAYTSAFYAQVGKPGFFAGLDLFPGARSLVDGIIEIGQGKLPNVLTAPVQSAHCAPEKQAVLQRSRLGSRRTSMASLPTSSVRRTRQSMQPSVACWLMTLPRTLFLGWNKVVDWLCSTRVMLLTLTSRFRNFTTKWFCRAFIVDTYRICVIVVL